MEPWQKTYDLAGYRCIYCKEPLGEDLRIWHNATEDHLYPRAHKHGGSGSAQNRVAACQLCNSLKDDYIPPIALKAGVIVTRSNGKKEVHPDFRKDYIEEVWAKIKERKKDRMKQFYEERKRLKKSRTRR